VMGTPRAFFNEGDFVGGQTEKEFGQPPWAAITSSI